MTDEDPRGDSGAPRFGERTRPEYGEYATPEEQRASIKATLPTGGGAAASDPPIAQSPVDRDGIPAWRDRGEDRVPRQADRPTPPSVVSRGRTVDRVATFALLGMGLYMTVNGLFTFGDLGAVLQNTVNASVGPGTGFVAPAWTHPVGLVVGAVYVLLWAGALLLSLRRLRSGRLAFWVPLVAGVIALTIVTVVVLAATFGDPAVVERLTTRPS